MVDSRLKKVLGDLWTDRARAGLVLLAIAVGVVGAGTVMDSGSILSRELSRSYMGTNPASAVLRTRGLDAQTLAIARSFPGVESIEPFDEFAARIRIGDSEWKTLRLFVLPDYATSRIDLIQPESGAWPPGPGQILIERAALAMLAGGPGATVSVSLGHGDESALSVAGIVHAPGLAPAWMERLVYGWVSTGTAIGMGAVPTWEYLRVCVSEGKMDKGRIAATARGVQAALEGAGVKVRHVEIPKPGAHPHATQMMTLLYLLETFGMLALALSGILVATMISALMARQTRQIGIMKAIGGKASQVAAMYFGMVLSLGALASCAALPVAAALARAYAAFAARMLNFSLFDRSIPIGTYLLQMAVGLCVPALSASCAIVRGSRITVREALSDPGFSDKRPEAGRIDRLLGSAFGASRPLLLSLRGAFRRRGRLALTLSTLAAGGAVFMTAMNVSASMDSTVETRYGAMRFDFMAVLSEAVPVGDLDRAVASVPGVFQYESWGRTDCSRILEDGSEGNSFPLVAFPSESGLQGKPSISRGRWFQAGDTDAVVLNQRVMALNPDLKMGDRIRLRTDAGDSDWILIGVTRELMANPTGYAVKERFDAMNGLQGRAKSLIVASEDRGEARVIETVRRVEDSLRSAGIGVTFLARLAGAEQGAREHFLVLAAMLVLMALLVVAVGVLGLSSVLSVNVLERTREIGVMRSIGATGQAIGLMVAAEGVLIGLLSWAAAGVLSWPVSRIMAARFGMIFFDTPLEFAVSAPGFLAWLGLAVFASLLASVAPAAAAVSIPVREAIAWE